MGLKFEDLQPHVDMLCDALENKGASSSGIPNENVYPFASKYRELLVLIRNKNIILKTLVCESKELGECTLRAAANNQSYRISKIVGALNVFLIKEYHKYND